MSDDELRAVHPDCGSQPVHQDKALPWFVGLHVKKRFTVRKRRVGDPEAERLWVLVTGYEDTTNELVGFVDNDVVYDCGVRYGSLVRVPLNEVIGVEDQRLSDEDICAILKRMEATWRS